MAKAATDVESMLRAPVLSQLLSVVVVDVVWPLLLDGFVGEIPRTGPR